MKDILQDICDLNTTWGNNPGDYCPIQEAAYPIEEALEGLDTTTLAITLDLDSEASPKDLSRRIIGETSIKLSTSRVDYVDKSLDSIYFAIGALHKLGLDPDTMLKALRIVHEANLAKSGAKDSDGKVIKQTTFVPPEESLAKLLNA